MSKNKKTLIASLSIVLALTLAPSIYGATLPTPIIDLGFNEGQGTTAANGGSAGGALTFTTPIPAWSNNVPPSGGKSCLDFGTTAGDYYAENSTPYSQLAGLEKFTITTWVNCRNNTEGWGGDRLVSWNNGNGDGADLVYRTDGSLQIGIDQWPDSSPARSSAGKIPTDAAAGTDNWRFIAVTYDSTLASEQVTFYFGSEVEPVAKDVAITYSRGALGANVRQLCIGQFNETMRGYNSAEQNRMFRGLIDEVKIFGDALTLEQIKGVLTSTQGLASSPNPVNGATDVSRDVGGVSWKPGEFANTHNVFWGTNINDVNDATLADPRGTTVYAGLASDANTVSLGRLECGTTYYWRVDEVNAPPSIAISKGPVWSFTTEPYSYPIKTAIKATASSQSSVLTGPVMTIDGSGLNALDQHSTIAQQMWMSKKNDTPIWIQYEFDQPYRLHQMWVWNQNQISEPDNGVGAMEVMIETSTDGTTWTALEGVPEFAQGPGEDTYVHNTTVDFHGVRAKFVKLNILSNFGGLKQAGLSEVRFFYVPMAARQADPANGATVVALDAILSWRAGREAAEHKVYLGADPQAVADGTAPATTVPQASYSPSLDLGTTYYWRVDEVNLAEAVSTWPGSVWSFTTVDHLVVDDMEGYTDVEGSRIYNTWVDGYGVSTNGCLVGNDAAPFANKTTYHGGRQSMPYRYNISGSFTLAEATRTFVVPQDWTASGIQTLRLFFYGNAANTAAGLYVKINGTKVAYTGDAGNVSKAEWTQWDVPLSSVPASVLRGVTSLTIGTGTGSGELLIDDIGLSH